MTQPWPSVGQQCICIKKDGWILQAGHPQDLGLPAYREVYTVSQTEGWCERHYVKINGHSDWYESSCFRPLVSKTESEDLAVFRRIADLAGVDEALRRLEGVE